MTDAFFSSFLMADRPTATTRGGDVPDADQIHSEAFERQIHDALARAFRQAVMEAVPDGAAFGAGSQTRLPDFADAVADLAVGRSVILQIKPGLGKGRRDAIRTFLESVLRVSANLEGNRIEAAIGKLADVLLPDELADARGVIAQDNLELRDRFVAEVRQLTSSAVGAQAGSKARNPYAAAARWKKAGEIFSVHHRGKEFFPAFQFRDGRPHPTVKKVLSVLPGSMSPWQRAFWFVSTNGWLGDKAPADMLSEGDAVVTAAEREGEEVVG